MFYVQVELTGRNLKIMSQDTSHMFLRIKISILFVLSVKEN